MKFCVREGRSLKFKSGLSNFSGNSYLMNKNMKNNHKYFVYDKEREKVIHQSEESIMSIVDIIKEKNNVFVFYIDSRHRLAFIKTRKSTLKRNLNDFIGKVELTPFFRFFMLPFFQTFIFFGVIRFRSYTFNQLGLSVGYDKSLSFKMKFLFPERIRSKFSMNTNKLSLLVHFCWCKVHFSDVLDHYHKTSDINNPIFIRMQNQGSNYYYNLKSKNKDEYNKRFFLYNSESYRKKKTVNELYMRKSITGQFVIVLTSYLSKLIKIKQKFAYAFAFFMPTKEKYNLYFEKFCEGASESAYLLFNHAIKIDDKAIFILEKSNKNFVELKRKYPDNVFAKNSFGAFVRIFLANSFISSDLVTHIQRRLYDNDRLIKKKILSNNKKVFLQHGVSLATNVFARGYYNTKVPISPDFIIVNSTYEKKMFLKNTGYKDEKIIKTGLANLDLYYSSKQEYKNEITFMLTWRPWDLTDEIEKGSYLSRYKEFIQLIDNHKFYKDKCVNVILHPKSRTILKEQFPEFYEKNEKKFYIGDIKEALLKTRVLISDYSSVTFFAFAGGSNIVFYWEDKELAEEKYGAPNILQKDLAFGDIVYRFEDLHTNVERSYTLEQQKKHIKLFGNLVEYDEENSNTKRTFNYLYKNLI